MLIRLGQLGRMGGSIHRAVATGLTWVTSANVTTTPTSMQLNVAGVGWAEAASSVEAQTGNFILDIVPTIAGNAMIGVNSDPLTNDSFTSIDYAMFCQSGGAIKVYESGAAKSTVGTYTAGTTVLSIKRIGTAITYYIDGVLVYTSLTASAVPLHIDSSLNTINSGFNSIAFNAA